MKSELSVYVHNTVMQSKNMNSIAWVHILGKSIKNNRATVTYTSCESPPIFKPSASTNN